MKYVIYKSIVAIIIVAIIIQLSELVINGYIADIINTRQTISCVCGLVLLGAMLPISWDVINQVEQNKMEE